MSLEYNNSPYKLIPDEIKNEYTMNEKIPVFEWYFDGRTLLKKKMVLNGAIV